MTDCKRFLQDDPIKVDVINLAYQCAMYLARNATPRSFVIGYARWQRILREWQTLQHIFGRSDPFPTTLHGLPVEIDNNDPERLTCKA